MGIKKRGALGQTMYLRNAKHFYFYYHYTGTNPTYAQAKIKLFAHNTVYCVKASFSYFLLFCLQSE